jgi:hypothetical protein
MIKIAAVFNVSLLILILSLPASDAAITIKTSGTSGGSVARAGSIRTASGGIKGAVLSSNQNRGRMASMSVGSIGGISTINLRPSTNNKPADNGGGGNGECCNDIDLSNYVTIDQFDSLERIVDSIMQDMMNPDDYYTAAEVDILLDSKQDNLTAGNGIVISDNVISISDDVNIGGGGDVSAKADKVSSATAGNLAGLDATGNLVDSGYAPGNFVRKTGDESIDGVKTFIVSPLVPTQPLP